MQERAFKLVCPECNHAIRGNPAWIGAKILCPGCKTKAVFKQVTIAGKTAPATLAIRKTESAETLASEGRRPTTSATAIHPQSPASGATIPCPMCAEPINPAAKKCKHCGEFLTGNPLTTNAGEVKKVKSSNLKLACYIGSGIILFYSLAMFTCSILAGLLMLVGGLLLCPALHPYVQKKASLNFSPKTMQILTLILACVLIPTSCLLLYWTEQQRERDILAQKQAVIEAATAKAEKDKQEKYGRFKADKQPVLAEIRQLISKREHTAAVEMANEYKELNDNDITELYRQARTLLLEKEIPTKDISAQIDLCEQLVALNPTNQDYRKRLATFKKYRDDKVAQAERAKIIREQFNPWDSSHRNLVKYVKENMNDPKSFEHVKTEYSDTGDGLTVIMAYRGKNAFGGLVKNIISVKVDYYGNITTIINQ